MKKITFLTTLLSCTTLLANAQTALDSRGNLDALLYTLNAVAILLSLYIASSFLLSIVRIFLDDRLRRQLIQTQTSEALIAQMLPKQDSLSQVALKWGCLLVASGVGLIACYFTQPYGLHSAIILSFSLAAGLLVFYWLTKPKNNTAL
jgi:hypothetical protein